MKSFWERVSSAMPFVPPAMFDSMRPFLNSVSARGAALFGVPGFFALQFPPPWFAADGTPQALSFYNSAALKSALNEFVDFDLMDRSSIDGL